ncbi:MAG: alpha/beta hydrolase [Gammaproteobacteria bacterium]|nr:MAG: alpha/beta hydrolase [Gammaproteobacteria bacterium]
MNASPTLLNALGLTDIPMADLEKLYTDEHSRYMAINGLNIHYRDVGEGPVIVLVHGMMSSLHTWNDWSAELEKSYRVIALDMPGYGLTGAPENLDEFDKDYLLSTFTKFIDTLGLQRFDLVGSSLGGFVAAHYAADYPKQIKHLILLNPIAYPQNIPWILKAVTAPGIKSVGKYIQPPILITLNIEESYGDPRRISEENMNRYVHMSQRPGAKAAYLKTIEILKNLIKQEVPLPFHRISAATFLIWGGKDKRVPPAMANYWQRDIPSSILKIYPSAGHLPMEEIPGATVTDALLFLNDDPVDLETTKLTSQD